MDIRAGTETAGLEQRLEVIMRTAQHGNPREAFGALEIAKVETPEKTDNKSNSAVM